MLTRYPRQATLGPRAVLGRFNPGRLLRISARLECLLERGTRRRRKTPTFSTGTPSSCSAGTNQVGGSHVADGLIVKALAGCSGPVLLPPSLFDVHRRWCNNRRRLKRRRIGWLEEKAGGVAASKKRGCAGDPVGEAVDIAVMALLRPLVWPATEARYRISLWHVQIKFTMRQTSPPPAAVGRCRCSARSRRMQGPRGTAVGRCSSRNSRIAS